MANGHGGRREGAGRKKGVPNKRTLEIEAKLAELGCDPIAGMAEIALDPENSPELRGKMHAELAQYIAPKRKAVELSGEVDLGLEDLIKEGRARAANR